jgi:hypothetical protein
MPPHDWSYPVDLLKAIDNAANYLSFVVNEDGRFKYQTFGDNYTEPDPIAYNAVRHAGTIYSLTLYIKYKWFTEHTIPTNVSDAAVLASSWLLKHIATPTDEKKTYSEYKGLLISKETELEKSKKDTFALGGNALSLVTLASLNEAHIIETDIEILRGIGRFIVKMKDENGDFPNHYFYEGKGFIPATEKKCDYYPGEAALALIKLYTVDPDIKWLESARDILEFLAKKHLAEETPDDYLIDHWYLISTQHIFLYQDIITLDKESLVACSVKFALFAISHPRRNWCAQNAIYEGFVSTCLLFKYEFSRGNTYNGKYEGILDVLTPQLIDGTQKLISCQTKTGGIARKIDDIYTQEYEIRIDYPQHTLCSWIRTYEFLFLDSFNF